MRTSTWRLYAAAAGFVGLAASAAMLAQSAPADPWTKVPALPTMCYYDQADFDRFDNAHTAIVADIERQKKVNAELDHQLSTMDPMVKMQKMQEFMMNNPQKAAEVACVSASFEELSGLRAIHITSSFLGRWLPNADSVSLYIQHNDSA